MFRIQRSLADPHVADPLSRTLLLAGMDNHHYSHSGGCLRFDAQGNLIVSFGDGSSYDAVEPLALDTYDLDSLNGKIVRVDRATGDGVAGNPYFDDLAPGATSSKVIARGFRNPFRFAIEPATGDLYVGDVGWSVWEEVDRVPAIWSDPDRTLNFGWPCYEGGDGESLFMDGYRFEPATAATCEGLYPPPDGTGIGAESAVYAYLHGGPGGELGSAVFFADYARDRFQLMSTDGAVEDFGTPGDWGNPVDIQMSPSGNVAYAAIGHGAIYEIVFDGDNDAPVAVATGAPLEGPVPLRVKLSGLQSHDPDGDRLHYLWDFAGATFSRQSVLRDRGGTTYLFDSWSDGLPASHELITPSAPLSLTATYIAQ